MVVYVVLEEHRAEGVGILGVFYRKPSQEFAEALAKRRTHYKEKEFNYWVTVAIVCYDVEEIEMED